jgi:hypothetical protein
MAVTFAQAVKLALAAIDSEIKRLNFDAYLYERLGAEHGAKAYKKRQRFREARAILAELLSNGETDRS